MCTSAVTTCQTERRLTDLDSYVGPGCAYPLENFIGTCEGNCYKPVANGDIFDNMWLVGGKPTLWSPSAYYAGALPDSSP